MSPLAPAASLFLALLLASCAASPPPGSAACAPRPLARLAVRFHADIPTVIARIDGQPVAMVLDLGAETTVLAEATADRLGLARDPSALPTITGVGGSMVRWAATARSLTLGDLTLDEKRVEVAPMSIGDAQQPVDGALGLDVLRKYDIDWDLPNREVTLNAPSGCDGPPVGWPSPAVKVPLSHPAAFDYSGGKPRLLLLPVAVDNRPMTALLDTGAGISLISPEAAAMVEPPSSGSGMTVNLRGVGPDSQAGTFYRFRSLTVGGDTLPGWVMVVGPVPVWAGGMVLGVGFMRLHRAWLPAGGSDIWFGPRTLPEASAGLTAR